MISAVMAVALGLGCQSEAVWRSGQIWRLEAVDSFFDSKAIRTPTALSNSECSVCSMPPVAIGDFVKRRYRYYGHYNTWRSTAHIQPRYISDIKGSRSEMPASVTRHKNTVAFMNWIVPFFPLRIVGVQPVRQYENYFIFEKEVFRDGKANIFKKHFALVIYNSVSLLHNLGPIYIFDPLTLGHLSAYKSA
ncbi:MAG: hypothetical protein AABY88_03085 [Pseudomonadota bacterium]